YGGPSFAQIAELVDRYGDATTELARLLRTVVFTAAIGNADAHGKNLSLIIDTDTGAVALAPLYDTVPTALWPTLRATPAMSVNGRFDRPSFHDCIAEARRWGMGATAAERVVEGALTIIRSAAAASEHAAVAELVSSRIDAIEASRGAS
ncbi:MAG: HipA domain-containing protein, partial [Actinobacteria bacterium]|nr:HipA domain-containing protein [Actinomycetota bacterium]